MSHALKLLYLYYIPAISWFLLMAVMTHIPISSTISAPQHSDKVIHFIVYAVLAALLFRILKKKNWNRYLLPVTSFLISYAAIDELLQGFVPGRNASFADFFADTFGVLIVFLFFKTTYMKT